MRSKPWVSVTGMQWRCAPLWMPVFTMGQTPPSLHGFDSLLTEAKPPASALVSPDHNLLRVAMHGSFSPAMLSPPASFQPPLRGGVICFVPDLHLVTWSWRRRQSPLILRLFPRYPPERTKVYTHFGRLHTVFSLLSSTGIGDQSSVCQ